MTDNSDNQYIVRIRNFPERTENVYNYNRVADAIQSAASFTTPERFNAQFFDLMHSGFMYIGDKSEEYPAGNQILFLTEAVDSQELERPLVPIIRYLPKQIQREVEKQVDIIAQRVGFNEAVQHEKG